ncbi:DUF5675 family protein [Carboxylicivirga sp. M1479]|uniref:DUF5675 family protein n=1 Tax=Carboxylicivirga sp. M1479 TaxID=2594476 RepID=UPI001178975C|nr:DUF5675 family protein [Carboxylicivirga sp. M1479]TRX70565.1 hypothetical protein FNN09_11345 [Carboxylicivirga sp. M1479]
MFIYLQRFNESEHDTLGLLFIDDLFWAFTLEDENRIKKLSGETRIPEGTYQIKLRTEGRLHERYKKRFPKMHQGMLHLQDVPGFEWIYIHIGNDEDDTAGCILVGDVVSTNIEEPGRLMKSSLAYQRIYSVITQAMERGEEVWIGVDE